MFSILTQRVINRRPSVGFSSSQTDLRSLQGHGFTATYGGLLGALALDREGVERRFREVLTEIRSGAFATKLQAERASGYPTLAAIRVITQLDNPLTAAEGRMRATLGDKPAGDRYDASPCHRQILQASGEQLVAFPQGLDRHR